MTTVTEVIDDLEPRGVCPGCKQIKPRSAFGKNWRPPHNGRCRACCIRSLGPRQARESLAMRQRREKVRELLEQNPDLTNRELADMFGVSPGAIWNDRKAMGLAKTKQEITKERQEKVLELANRGWRQVGIAAELGWSRWTIEGDFRALGLERHKRSIQTPTDPAKSTEIVERVVTQLAAAAMALEKVNGIDLRPDAEQLVRWQKELRAFRAAYYPIHKRVMGLRKGELSGTHSTQADPEDDQGQRPAPAG